MNLIDELNDFINKTKDAREIKRAMAVKMKLSGKSGKTLWYLIPRVNTKWLNIVYEQFARDAGVGEEKLILLVEDQAGWRRSEKVEVPEGNRRNRRSINKTLPSIDGTARGN